MIFVCRALPGAYSNWIFLRPLRHEGKHYAVGRPIHLWQQPNHRHPVNR